MNGLLNRRREDVAAAMQGLSEALGRLAFLRDAMMAAVNARSPGSEDRPTLLGLERACNHLTQAAVDVPPDCWRIMLEERKLLPKPPKPPKYVLHSFADLPEVGP